MSLEPHPLLRAALRVDATGCALFAAGIAVFVLGPRTYLTQLGAPVALLLGIGALALVGVPLFLKMARRRRVLATEVWIIAGSNAAWSAFSGLALLAEWVRPTRIGAVVIIVQAALTGAIAVLELLGLWRSAVR